MHFIWQGSLEINQSIPTESISWSRFCHSDCNSVSMETVICHVFFLEASKFKIISLGGLPYYNLQ